MPYDFGDIILVKFPYTNQVGLKQRPAVVVSNRNDNEARPDVVAMAVTSQLSPSTTFGEFQIADWQSANLVKPSAIKPLFASIEQTLIVRKLGTLQPSDRTALRNTIATLLG